MQCLVKITYLSVNKTAQKVQRVASKFDNLLSQFAANEDIPQH